MKTNIKKMCKERDAALIAFVMDNDVIVVERYCAKYSVPTPANNTVFKAGLYKATLGCTSIPAEVRAVAAEKCKALGFKPTIW